MKNISFLKKPFTFFLLFFSFFLLLNFFGLKNNFQVYAGYACNESCSQDINGCTLPYTCSSGVCRNPSCPEVAGCVCPTPTPTPYPTIHITGIYYENLGPNICGSTAYSANTAGLQINITPQAPAGVTPVCSKNATNYSCDVKFDNQHTPSVNPAQDLTLSTNYPPSSGYSNPEWRTSNLCSGTVNNSLSVDARSPANPYTRDLFFLLGTRGDGGGGTIIYKSWFKLSTSSLNVRSNIGNNIIPQTIQAFDSDDTTDKYLIVNNAGIVANANKINLGYNTSNYTGTNWIFSPASPYTFGKTIDQSTYNEYLKTRKDTYVPITDINQMNTPNKVYVLTCNPSPCNQTIDNNGLFSHAPLVLLIKGSATIDVNSFNSSNESIAIIATDKITFSASTSKANGIFIADNIDTDTTTNQELKINGNLIATSNFTNNRKRSDNRKPALFVVFDMQKYIDLLPYLSTAKYEWTQLK